LVYEDKVLDVSGWAEHHPGLPKTILRFAGKSATDEIRQMHGDWVINKKLPLFTIGTVSNPPQPNEVQLTFRALYDDFVKKGYFECNDVTYYQKKLALYIPMLAVAVYLIVKSNSDIVHTCASILMGAFFWQMAFIGHDAGHMSATGSRELDYDYGLIVGNFLTGISVGWWKATHNVHHAVPNSLHSDPDIAHLPVFAVDTRMFESLYNTYHQRIMKFDWAAQNIFIPYQHYLYYPIMFFARFNLYLQSFILLIKDPHAQRRKREFATLFGFWAYQFWLMSYLNSWAMVWVYLLLSNGVAGLLHVQITLSHFSMPVVDDSKVDDYGGDFFSRNVKSSLDVSCPEWADWFHGGLQFQTEHHCFPRMRRNFLRKARPAIKAACLKHDLPWNEMGFIDCNKDIIRCLREAATVAKEWNPMINESFNAHG